MKKIILRIICCVIVLVIIITSISLWLVYRPKNIFEEMYQDAVDYGNPKISNMNSLERDIEKGEWWYGNTATVFFDISCIDLETQKYISPDIDMLCDHSTSFSNITANVKKYDEGFFITFVSGNAELRQLQRESVLFWHSRKWTSAENESVKVISIYTYSFSTEQLSYYTKIELPDGKRMDSLAEYLEKDNFLEYIIYDWCTSNSKEATDRSPTEFSYDDWGEVTIVE